MTDAPPIPPRLLSRDQAAAYVGISPTQFDEEVAAGTFPAPFKLAATRRCLWDRVALDRAIDRQLIVAVDAPTGGEPWDDRRQRWTQARAR